MSLNKPIFILGSHKSGSSLLRSLLDGHKELYVIPTETHFFQYSGHWVDYRLRYNLPKKMNRQDLVDSFVSFVRKKNNHADIFADSILTNKFDIDKFKSSFDESNLDSPRKCFEAYIRAIRLSMEGECIPENTRIVEKSVENAEFAIFLRQMFPDSRFIHIVRNPYATLVSVRKTRKKHNFPYLRDYLFSLKNSYYYLLKNVSYLDNYYTLKYEDLLASPEESMKKVSIFLGIDFSKILTEPTLMGEPWKGNSSREKTYIKISKDPLYGWESTITDLEIQLVNDFFEPVLNYYSYEKLNVAKEIDKILPINGESVKTYFKNRALLWLKPTIQKAP